MAFAPSPYIDERDGALKIAGTRVSLASVVIAFRDGESPERIAQDFPALTLAQVYGAIAYYLEHEKTIDEYLARVDREFEASTPPLSDSNPELYARLEAARDCSVAQRSKDESWSRTIAKL